MREGWTESLLGSLAQVEWGNTSLTKASYTERGYTAFSASGPDGYVSQHEHDGDGIVLSAIGARCGRCFWATNQWTAIKNTITVTNSKDADLRFLFHFLNREGVWPSSGGAQPFIGLAKARTVMVQCPPLPEQRKIAAILSSVDDAIEKSSAVIDQLEVVKKALIQELLTRGLPGRHTLFKHTEIGEIPEGWEVVRADEFCAAVTDGTHDSPKPSPQGVPLVTSKNLKNGYLTLEGCYLISQGEYEKISVRSAVEPGDILFGMIGTLGNPVAVEPAHLPFAPKNVGIFRLGGDKARSRWLLHVLRSSIINEQVADLLSGSSQKFVGLGKLRGFGIPVPPIDEMEKLSTTIDAIDTRIRLENNALAQGRTLKSSLLSTLLSGELRVPLDQEAA